MRQAVQSNHYMTMKYWLTVLLSFEQLAKMDANWGGWPGDPHIDELLSSANHWEIIGTTFSVWNPSDVLECWRETSCWGLLSCTGMEAVFSLLKNCDLDTAVQALTSSSNIGKQAGLGMYLFRSPMLPAFRVKPQISFHSRSRLFSFSAFGRVIKRALMHL